ncbi:MAG: transposase [Propionibacteriaceae bacterium]
MSDIEKAQIDLLHNRGESYRQIANAIGRSHHVVMNYLKNPESYGVKNGTKGNTKITKRQKNQIIKLASTGNFTAAGINSQLGLSLSKRRTCQIIKGTGHFKYKKRMKIPNLKPEHITARLKWAKTYMNYSTEWTNMIFSDEKKFNLDGPDGFQYYWHDLRRDPQFKLSRNFGGGSLMVWAGFSATGKTMLAKIGTRMNSQAYTDMLEAVLIPFIEDNMTEDVTFQQDNASIHVSRHSLEWFKDKDIELFDHPARSPDLNPMENLWGIMARKVYEGGRQYDSVEDLEVACRNAWREIRLPVLESLINSMPNRVFEVIRMNGKQINT